MYNILVCDDDREIVGALEIYLATEHYNVFKAYDGEQALKLLARVTVDLVITDCNMPDMTGIELTQILRSRALGPVTVWGYTANAQADARGECLAAGMDDCLQKPIGIDALASRLAALTAATPDHRPLSFDPRAVAKVTGNHGEFAHKLYAELLRANAKDLAALRVAVARDDWTGVEQAAHALKGGARIVGADALVTACEYVEKQCQQAVPPATVDIDGIKASVQTIEAQAARLNRDIESVFPVDYMDDTDQSLMMRTRLNCSAK